MHRLFNMKAKYHQILHDLCISKFLRSLTCTGVDAHAQRDMPTELFQHTLQRQITVLELANLAI